MMMAAQELQSELCEFTGTRNYHRWSPLFPKHLLTDGVEWLCRNSGCFWLVDIIASYHDQAIADEMLRELQFWTLQVNEDKSAVVTCDRDIGDTAFSQKVPSTDFPLPSLKLWVELDGSGNYVILLPSEH